MRDILAQRFEAEALPRFEAKASVSHCPRPFASKGPLFHDSSSNNLVNMIRIYVCIAVPAAAHAPAPSSAATAADNIYS